MRFNEFDKLIQDYKLLSSQLEGMRAGATYDDPALLDALVELSEASRKLQASLGALMRAQASQSNTPRNKPVLRLVK